MCQSCIDADEAGKPKTNKLVPGEDNDWDQPSISYWDHDGDPIKLTVDTYYEEAQQAHIPVYLVESKQGGKTTIIRVPQEILLEMMDRLGYKLPEGVKG